MNRKTVERKFLFLARKSKIVNEEELRSLPRVKAFQFDDLETIEHTKMKPLSVTMAVEKSTRRILAFEVGRMPAKGLLAKKSRKKYGPRPDERGRSRKNLFERISNIVAEDALIESDQNPHYLPDVKKYFPKCEYKTTPGGRGSVAGQGELKKLKFDPLFSLNHTYAMLRANINRLFRKTWCTTKLPERLTGHIELYVRYHNAILLKNPAPIGPP